jgi:hypothetical protein
MALFEADEMTQGTYVEPNVEDSLSSLFKEIGNTLKDVTKQGISTLGDTVKTSLANKIMASPQGQAQISAYKMDYLMKYLPWIVLFTIAIFIGGRYLRSS